MPSHKHQTPFVGNLINDGSYTSSHANFLYGTGETASQMGQKTEFYNSDGSNQAEGNEYAYMVKATGGNAVHTHGDTSSVSNLPPYMTVYVWKRIQ